MKNTLIAITSLFSTMSFAADWGGSNAPIEKMYVYTNMVVVIQGAVYKGHANCAENNKWGFYWSSMDEKTADRIYSTLLAAYMSKTPVKPIFDSNNCGPEGAKRFNGNFIL